MLLLDRRTRKRSKVTHSRKIDSLPDSTCEVKDPDDQSQQLQMVNDKNVTDESDREELEQVLRNKERLIASKSEEVVVVERDKHTKGMRKVCKLLAPAEFLIITLVARRQMKILYFLN